MSEWKKVKIGDFLTEREGRYKPNDKEISKYQRLDKIDFSGHIHISDKPTKTDMIIVFPGDLIISGINVAKGAISVYQGKEPVCATIHYSSYTFDDKKVDLDYFKYFVKSPAFIFALQQQVKGGIKTEIKPKHLLPLEISLPDLSTQKEIVKVLSKKIEKVELIKSEIESQKNYAKQLRQNILQEAIEGKLTEDLPCRQAGWRKNSFRNLSGKLVPKESDKFFAYVLECNDGSLYKGYTRNLFERINRHLEERGAEWTAKHTPVSLIHFEEFNKEKEALEREKYFKSGSGREYINEIRNRNKLDYDAEALFEKIQVEKCHTDSELPLETSLRIRNSKKKEFESILENEQPFEIPEGWKWVRLGEICKKITDGSHNPPPNAGKGYPVISAMNIKKGEISFDTIARYTDEIGFQKENKRTQITRGDLIMGIIGASIGNIAIYNHDEKVIAQRSIAIIDTYLSNFFIRIVLSSKFIQNDLQAKAFGSAQGGVYLGKISNLIFPLPPLAEQKEIVFRVEKLLANVTELEKQITEREEMTKQLMQSIMKDAFREV